MNLLAFNKSPGIDGFPLETYDEHWETISDDMLSMYKLILENGRLGKTQR